MTTYLPIRLIITFTIVLYPMEKKTVGLTLCNSVFFPPVYSFKRTSYTSV